MLKHSPSLARLAPVRRLSSERVSFIPVATVTTVFDLGLAEELGTLQFKLKSGRVASSTRLSSERVSYHSSASDGHCGVRPRPSEYSSAPCYVQTEQFLAATEFLKQTEDSSTSSLFIPRRTSRHCITFTVRAHTLGRPDLPARGRGHRFCRRLPSWIRMLTPARSIC